jgi:hypothetical protein
MRKRKERRKDCMIFRKANHQNPTKLSFVLGLALSLNLLIGAGTIGTVSALTVTSNKYNCDDNSVIAGGARTVSDLQSKYVKGATCTQSNGTLRTEAAYHIQDVYHGFGISPSDISAMSSDAVSGYVTKTGDVYTGSPSNPTLVATAAYTAGLTGPQSEQHNYGATNYYVRPPSESFLDDALSAMVIMKGGVFQHAILNSCGNPVNATPKKPSPPPPVTHPPAPRPPTPYFKCVQLDGSVVDQSKMSFIFTATAAYGGGAVFNGADFNFGDGTTLKGVRPTTSTRVTVSHVYNIANTYNANATLHFTVNGQAVTAPACPLLVPATGTPVQECKPGVPMGSPACTPCPTDTSVPSNECPPVAPPSLPNTGAGDTIAIFAAVAIAGFLVYRQVIFRKHRAAFLAAEQGTSPLPLRDALSGDSQPHVARRAHKLGTLRRKRPY